MDIREIEKLIKLLNKTGISEIEIKEGTTSVRVTRHGMAIEQPYQAYIPQHQPPAPNHPAPAFIPDNKPVASVATGHQVRSPMVGTLYASPSPEMPAFVTVGQPVAIGDTLCIIEAMKMFNEIEADKTGVITAILVTNGEPVEYDQPLFIIE
jgi:acetyl-CoA carboxylase biotin carboxyl carrier protein